jgi:hypothetical protein
MITSLFLYATTAIGVREKKPPKETQHFAVWDVDIGKRICRVTVYARCSLTIEQYDSSPDFVVLVHRA